MYKDGKLWIATANGNPICLRPEMANRHGLITGASGTGKTVTLKVIAESFSDMGVPVFLQDIKGDVSGMIVPGEDNENMQERIQRFGITGWSYKTYPTRFWDVYGEKGHPVRITISDLGPTLIARLLELTDVQESVLNMVFKIADDNGLLLIDLKDLRSMLQFVSSHKSEFENDYGAVSTVSIQTIMRNLLKLEDEGAAEFFGEPNLDITDWMRTDVDGRGYINLLHSVKLALNPVLYATFMLWMLSSVYERLPEVGDLDKPRMVFFFDEAHMLFTDAPSELKKKILQVIKLVRSKGVGVYFITQSPSDIPDDVLAQLSNRVQHALRAYTPNEQKAVRAAANSFRQNPAFDTETAIQELKTGEALVSFLDEDGAPSVVERAFIMPPQSYMGQAPESEIQKAIQTSEFEFKYRQLVDRESAYEIITDVAAQEAAAIEEAKAQAEAEKAAVAQAKADEKAAKAREKEEAAQKKKAQSFANRVVGNAAASASRTLASNTVDALLGSAKSTAAGKAIKSAVRSTSGSIGREVGKSLVRGLLGNLK